jgi:hypothetical protein
MMAGVDEAGDTSAGSALLEAELSGGEIIASAARKAGRGCQTLVGVPGRTVPALPLRGKRGDATGGLFPPCQACCCTTHRLPSRNSARILPFLRHKPYRPQSNYRQSDSDIRQCHRKIFPARLRRLVLHSTTQSKGGA